jgi:hypothetical protein
MGIAGDILTGGVGCGQGLVGAALFIGGSVVALVGFHIASLSKRHVGGW